MFKGFNSQNLLQICYDEWKITFWVQHNGHISLVKLTWRSSSQLILFLVLKHLSLAKSVFLDDKVFFCVFSKKYCAVPEKFFSMSALYLHFPHCKLKLFLSIDRVQNLACKGPNSGFGWLNWVPNQILRVQCMHLCIVIPIFACLFVNVFFCLSRFA